MQKKVKIIFAIGSLLLCTNSAFSDIPNTNKANSFLGPTVRLKFTRPFTDNTAFSLLGEAGIDNYRLGGTLGLRIDDNLRLKISGEYLWQKNTYAFFFGHTNQWVGQGALGIKYQYDYLDIPLLSAIYMDAYLSQARSKTFSDVTGTFTNSNDVNTPFLEERRIAGSHGRGIGPGIYLTPWNGARISVLLNYDQIRYDKQNSPEVATSGLGGTLGITQAFKHHINFGLAGSDRKLFNNYESSLTWSNVQFYGNWTLGIYGNYTIGKNGLANTYNISLSTNYVMENPWTSSVNLKATNIPSRAPTKNDFLAWTAEPAVYMPQVLAISDSHATVCPQGNAPSILAPISEFEAASETNINLAPNFSGQHLTFTLISSSPAIDIAGGDFITLSPQGLLSYQGAAGGPYFLTIEVANACGSVTTSFDVALAVFLTKKGSAPKDIQLTA